MLSGRIPLLELWEGLEIPLSFGSHLNAFFCQARQPMPVIPEFEKLKQKNHQKSNASLNHRVNSGPALATMSYFVSKDCLLSNLSTNCHRLRFSGSLQESFLAKSFVHYFFLLQTPYPALPNTCPGKQIASQRSRF